MMLDDFKDRISKFIPSRDQSSAPLSGGFTSDGNFDDEQPLSNVAIVIHALQIFLIFLAMCCFADVAAFQAQWSIGPSFLSGFAVFVSVTGLLLSAWMLTVPVIYWKWNKLKAFARPLYETRVRFILGGFGTGWLLLISFITTISAWSEAGCQNAANDPNASLGKAYQAALPGWCTTKKAGAAFFWMTFIAWTVTLGVAIWDWRTDKHTRPKDPPFVHPVETIREEDEAFDAREHNYESVTRQPDEEQAVDSPFRDPYAGQSVPAASRASMDTYGAFSDPAPTGFGNTSPGVSRTMQYADPYAAIRANLGAASPTSETGPVGAGAPPGPPAYTGYR